MSSARDYHKILANIEKVILGKSEVIEDLLCCWLVGGHALLEDVPGTGKTILARALAKSIHVPFKRVQFTPDLLPSDILGSSIYNQKTQEFQFLPGPVFTVILLADEINRATPRTQSALLECMSEKQVTIEGKTYKLEDLFFTVATQNPVDQLGTFTLPEAQLDRFTMKIQLGYPSQIHEIDILKNQNQVHPIHKLEPVLSIEGLHNMKKEVDQVLVTDEIYKYITDIVEATRNSSLLSLGGSTRSSISLVKTAQAKAFIQGRNYVSPENITPLVEPVLGHRVIPSAESRMAGLSIREILQQIIQTVKVPVQRNEHR